MDLGHSDPRCAFIPPYLLEHAIEAWPDDADAYRETLQLDGELRTQRLNRAGEGAAPAAPAAGAAWTVHTAANGTRLPGRPVRSAGEPESGDAAVDEAAYGVTGSLALFREVHGRDSYDDAGAPVILTVHYGRSYDNAFWNGTQLVFGDGDGRIFDRFTKPVDVLGHEFTHAVTEYTAGLVYRDQPGALNESISDVFAACLKQRLLGQTVTQADWLIGAGLFLPGVNARALRDMAAPGTAYDDPVIGKDPQVGHMDDYVDTGDDNGGVHLNSGIPNRAFQLAATAIGGHSWEGAGPIWYAALTSDQVRPGTRFAGFAAATAAAAGEHADAVTQAWADVGVTPSDADDQADEPVPFTDAAVQVRRSGGLVGRTTSGSVELDGDDPRADEVRDLVGRIDLDAVRGGPSHPDMYSYTFVVGGREVTVPEHQLTEELRRLATVVLEDD